MAQPKTITSFFIKGAMSGSRYVQFSFPRLRLFIIPRLEIGEITAKYDELNKPCLYILIGEYNGENIAYVGQASSFKKRIIDHLYKKPNWDKAYIFVASDKKSFTNSYVQYLEYRAIKDAFAANTYKIENSNKSNKPILSEHEEADLEQIYESEILQLTEFAGCNIFVKAENTTNQIFQITAKNITAHGYYDTNSNQFIVQKGSELVGLAVESYKNKQQREQKIKQFAEEKSGKFVLKKDIAFNSPSGASGFVLGRPSNGWDEWKDKDGNKLSSITGLK